MKMGTSPQRVGLLATIRNTLPFTMLIAGMALLTLSAFDLLEYAHFFYSFAWR